MEQKTETRLITEQTTIGDAIAKYPKTAEVMLSYGLHCVGCHVNTLEAVGDGARGHGMPVEEINKLIDEMNKVAEQQEVATKDEKKDRYSYCYRSCS